MQRLADYLDIDQRQAREQWLLVKARGPRPETPGWRQVDFLPVETLLCLAASVVVNHRRFGGSTSHLAPSPVPELARLFRRTPASVLAKMANLDGSRPNGARYEVEASAFLMGDPVALSAVYVAMIDGARSVGIGIDEFPDFLDLESGTHLRLLGQDELAGEDIEGAVRSRLAALAGRMGASEQVTERLLIASVRVGQHRFARAVLANCGHRCVFCGLRPGIELEGRGLLVASHIKPWRASSERERLDPTNGVSACPSHDAAFDGGLLWVNGGLRIRASQLLNEAGRRDPAMAASFGQPPIETRLVLPPGAHQPGMPYLAWHRQHVAAA